MFKSRIISIALSAFLLTSVASHTVSASTIADSLVNKTASPYASLEATGNKLFQRIKNNQQTLERFPDAMRTIVEEELMPMIDYRYAAYKVLGTNLRKTTAEQRQSFVSSMRQYLIRTYSQAFTSYNNQQVIFESEKNVGDKKIVAVNTKIIDDNQSEVNISFLMRKNKKTQQWKVYDMVVEGISLLNTKKSELNQRIKKQGLEQVTLELAAITR